MHLKLNKAFDLNQTFYEVEDKSQVRIEYQFTLQCRSITTMFVNSLIHVVSCNQRFFAMIGKMCMHILRLMFSLYNTDLHVMYTH